VHGAYVPEGVVWSLVDGSRDHHRVYLLCPRPGRVRRTRVLLGEVRRYRTSGRHTRYWRAFPAGVLEFPEVFENHYLAMEYLRGRWESRCASPEQMRPPDRRAAADGSRSWEKFFGELSLE
jgi:hypothetical protein